jgi:hypothetical protein
MKLMADRIEGSVFNLSALGDFPESRGRLKTN